MASGFAKHTARLACCIGTTGLGAIHLMNGLHGAMMDGAPVIARQGLARYCSLPAKAWLASPLLLNRAVRIGLSATFTALATTWRTQPASTA